MDNYGILSLAPAAIALILAFVTRDALLSILIGVLVGIVIDGQNIVTGFTGLIQEALGNADFIWVLGIEVFIGIMVAFFQKSGAIRAFADWIGKYNLKAKGATFLSFALGIFIFFSDYFSPLSATLCVRSPTRREYPEKCWPTSVTLPLRRSAV